MAQEPRALTHAGSQSQQQRAMYLAVLLDKLQAAFRVNLEPTENEIWLEDLNCLLDEVGKARLEAGVTELIRTWKREYGKTYFPLLGELRDCIPAPQPASQKVEITEEERRDGIKNVREFWKVAKEMCSKKAIPTEAKSLEGGKQ